MPDRRLNGRLGKRSSGLFFTLDSSLQKAWLIALLLLWAILLFGGFIFGTSKEGRRMPAWTRLISSAVLVVAATSWALISRGEAAELYALFIAVGMSFGFLGDCFLAQLFISGRKSQLGGIGAFALGHLFYITGIWLLGNTLGLSNGAARLGALLVWWACGALGWYFVVYRGSKATSLHWIVLPYALLLATTAGAATGLALQAPAFWPLALGAALFLFSDMLIGGNWFNNLDLPLIHDVIWLTYGPGQMLIVYSVGTAVQAAALPAF
jgi:hypothetical protein